MSQPDLFNSFTKTNHRQPYPAISPSLAPLSAKNKTILITGGSQGIGLAIAKAFAIAGASHIVLLARREGPLDAAKIDIEAESPSTKVHTFAADITDLEHAKKVFTLFPDPDVLVLCAGYLHHTQPALKVPLEDVRASFEINVIGNMALVQAYLAPLLSSPSPLGDETPQTLAAKQRTILNITTSVSQFPMPGMSIYGSSKGALVHLLGHVQNEYGSEGVHVRNIHPGHIYTRLLENHGMSEDFWSWDTSKWFFVDDVLATSQVSGSASSVLVIQPFESATLTLS